MSVTWLLPVWSIGDALAAAWRTMKRVPIGVLFALGVVPAVWALPFDLLVAPWLEGLDFHTLLRQAASASVRGAWIALIMGGQTLIALDLAGGAGVRLDRYREGLRAVGPMFALSVLSVPILILLRAVASGSPTPFGSYRLAISLAAMGFALVAAWLLLRVNLALFVVMARYGLLYVPAFVAAYGGLPSVFAHVSTLVAATMATLIWAHVFLRAEPRRSGRHA